MQTIVKEPFLPNFVSDKCPNTPAPVKKNQFLKNALPYILLFSIF